MARGGHPNQFRAEIPLVGMLMQPKIACKVQSWGQRDREKADDTVLNSSTACGS